MSVRRDASVRRIPQVEAFDDRFADNLRMLRQARKISRRELGSRTGIPMHSIEKIERGNGYGLRRRVTIGEAIVLAEALGVQPGELLKGAAQ